MPRQVLSINDRYDYKRTDWRDQAYAKINANFAELYAAGGGGGDSSLAVLAHEALGDPHAQYLLPSEANALYEALGASSATLAAHLLAADPHPNYLTAVEGSSLYASAAAPLAAVATHEGLADPHPQYLSQAEGDARYQGTSATLAALAALNATVGLLEQTGVGSFTKRSVGIGSSTSIPTRADADARYDAIGSAALAQAASQEASARLSAITGLSVAGYLYFNGTTVVSQAGAGGGGGNSYFPGGWT